MPIITLNNGQTMQVPDGTSQEVIDRWKAQAEEQAKTAAPSVPSASEGDPALAATSTAVPDASEQDPWGTWLDKHIRAAVHGTGRGIAQTADALKNYVYDPLANTAGAYAEPFIGKENVPAVRDYRDAPVLDAFERAKKDEQIAPVAPGKGYQQTSDVAEVVGPAALETLLTGSPKSGVVSKSLASAAKQAPATVAKQAVKVAARTARDVGGGYAGGELGGFVGDLAGQKELGQILGSAFLTPTLTSGTKLTASKALTNADSLEDLNVIRRMNERAGEEVISPSLGLVGSKGASLLEDVTGRGYISGGPAQRARHDQFAGMEKTAKDAADRLRGRPADSKISKETIGTKNDAMAKKALGEIKTKISTIQEDLANKVGPGARVDPGPVEDSLNDIINSREVGENLKADARVILRDFRKNYPPPQSGIGPPAPPTYGAVKDERGGLGAKVNKGARLSGKVKDPAYAGMTEAMRKTAEREGVLSHEFDTAQAETKRLYDQEKQVQPLADPGTERAKHDRLFSSANKKSLEQLKPYGEHTPQELSDVMADSLELRLRGESNAGLPEPQPGTFDPKRVETEWAATDPEFKEAYSAGNPTIQSQLDDLAHIARKEAARAGTRTRPGAGGNTLGTSLPWQGTAAGTGVGAVGSVMSGSIWPLLAGAVVTPAVSAGLAGANYGAGRTLTNPRVAESVVNPRYLDPATAVPQMLGGIPVPIGLENMDVAAEAAREEERRKVDAMRGRGR